MERGRSRWMTKRMSGLSIPMPKATVATTTSILPAWKASWTRSRTSASRPAWYAAARTPWSERNSAVSSTERRESA